MQQSRLTEPRHASCAQWLCAALLSAGTLPLAASPLTIAVQQSAMPQEQHSASAHHAPQAQGETPAKHRSNYWHIGLEAMSPFTFATLYSWNNRGDFHPGLGAQLSGGYQFSSVFGVQGAFGLGRSHATASDFQQNFLLGQHDAYTYYPYTMIDGTIYRFPANGAQGAPLVGEQGNQLPAIGVATTPFPLLKSEMRFWQASVNASFNLTRLFFAATYSERPVELWLRPGLYLSHYSAKVRHRDTDVVVAPKANQQFTWGLGGDLAVRFNLSSHWAIDVTNRLIWQHDRSLDGVRSIRRAYDNYAWQPAVGVVYKFRRAATPCCESPQAHCDFTPSQPIPVPAPIHVSGLNAALAQQLVLSLPERIALPEAKPRNYSASISLTYPLNQTQIVRHLHNNAAELARVDKELREITAHPDYKVRDILVEGFASPEGPLDNNRMLSTRRAQSIIDYLVTQNPKLRREQFQLGRVAENWEGLRDTLTKDPSLPAAREVIALLDRGLDTEEVKRALKNIPGYRALVKQVYPYLRKSSYTVHYDVRSYALSEAKTLLATHPENVGAEEMFAVALDAGLETAEGQKALALLEQHHGASPIARLLKAHRCLHEDKAAEALSLLQSAPMADASYHNLMGVALARLGRWEEAKQQFQRSGDAAASRNLHLISLAQ